jgi:uncharacterized membrane protein YcaP (DUF421 family)
VDKLLHVDWHAVFIPSASIAEIVVRGVITYLVLFCVLRILRRETGAIGISDLLVVVLIADAIQNGMAGSYTSVTEGVVLVLTIAMCDYGLDWLGFRVPAVQRFLRPAPLLLIDNGEINRRNLRKEMITMDELRSLLREQGVDDVGDVKECYLEGDGRISVVRRDGGNTGGGQDEEQRRMG